MLDGNGPPAMMYDVGTKVIEALGLPHCVTSLEIKFAHNREATLNVGLAAAGMKAEDLIEAFKGFQFDRSFRINETYIEKFIVRYSRELAEIFLANDLELLMVTANKTIRDIYLHFSNINVAMELVAAENEVLKKQIAELKEKNGVTEPIN